MSLSLKSMGLHHLLQDGKEPGVNGLRNKEEVGASERMIA
jgi:hypothetical protein